MVLILTVLNLRKTYVGILFDHQLKFHLHTTDVAAKANHLLGLIRKSFDYLNPDMLVKLFVTVVRPTLENCNSVWGPLFIVDQRKIKKVQRRATRLLSPISDRSYGKRLSILQLPSLAYRRLRGDMILLYRILNGHFSSNFSALYTYPITTPTRGHQFKLFKHHSRLNCRSIKRLINDWNNLPPFLVNDNCVNSFKFLLDNYFADSRSKFCTIISE